jgi:Tfp pilus assembly protein PilO
MSMTQRLTMWLLIMLLGMSVICFWSWQQMQEQHRIAQLTANDELQCKAIGDQISQLRDAAQSRRPDEDMNTLVQQMQQAASQSSMPMSHVQRIRPSAERRIGQSPYVEKPTQLSLSNITLPQAVAFLHHLATLQPDLQIQSLRITEDRRNQTSDQWQIEVGLANVIYSPPVKAPTRKSN